MITHPRSYSILASHIDSLQHGRVKVKTTAQQEAEKQLERQKKLCLYKAALGRIFEKVKLQNISFSAKINVFMYLI